MDIEVHDAGEEQMPTTEAERTAVRRFWSSNAQQMNELFEHYFGLNPHDRYMGSFPYSDKATGQPCVKWVLAMGSIYMRDTIVACLRAAIRDGNLADIAVNKSVADDENALIQCWPAQMEVVARGPSITDTLDGERCVRTALNLLQGWLLRA